jgi:ankyrin repeat protein
MTSPEQPHSLPERPSLEYLRKVAKKRLRDLRHTDPHAKLATALLAVARDYGFSSWRALKAEIAKREKDRFAVFFDACAEGDVERMRQLIAEDPSLVRVANTNEPHGGWTALHSAARRGHLDAVLLLLEHGADPNAREAGDNTYPLHWAAAARHIETVRALLDAGGDVHGLGDLHQLDVIGWATYFHPEQEDERPDVVPLLLERGAHHHIFSAMSIGDPDLIRALVEEHPDALDRRMSRFEHGLTPLHFTMSRKRYDLLDLLIELGADLEAEDDGGQTALAVAMLRGDQEAMRRLHAAGAKQPPTISTPSFTQGMSKLSGSITRIVPMITVPDVATALDWYTSIGFTEVARYGDSGVANFGLLSFGGAQLMLNMHGKVGRHDAGLWFYTDRIDELYQLLKSRQLEAARASLAGDASVHQSIEFVEDIYDPFYGGRQFSILDLNGYELLFYQE